eukprot:5208493-Amphidinium_carterae.1
MEEPTTDQLSALRQLLARNTARSGPRCSRRRHRASSTASLLPSKSLSEWPVDVGGLALLPASLQDGKQQHRDGEAWAAR